MRRREAFIFIGNPIHVPLRLREPLADHRRPEPEGLPLLAHRMLLWDVLPGSLDARVLRRGRLGPER